MNLIPNVYNTQDSSLKTTTTKLKMSSVDNHCPTTVLYVAGVSNERRLFVMTTKHISKNTTICFCLSELSSCLECKKTAVVYKRNHLILDVDFTYAVS